VGTAVGAAVGSGVAVTITSTTFVTSTGTSTGTSTFTSTGTSTVTSCATSTVTGTSSLTTRVTSTVSGVPLHPNKKLALTSKINKTASQRCRLLLAKNKISFTFSKISFSQNSCKPHILSKCSAVCHLK
jgi:hypothetical protein